MSSEFPRQLEGKVALVTGAAQGIGQRIAEFLAVDGASVMLADIQLERATEVADRLVGLGLRAASTWVDIADPAAAREMVGETIQHFGHVDILINNAGIDAPPGSAWELTEDDWRRIIDVDLSGAWWCTSALLPHLMDRGTGRIIFISSVSARIGATDVAVAYNAAKAGLIGLTVGLSVQLERYGILVNAIAPGPTGTGQPISEEKQAIYDRLLPLGLGGPEPIAHACLYLARESGNWISGSVLNVSGGYWRG